MTPIRAPSATHNLVAPGNWDSDKRGECGDLPATYEDGVFYSYWMPTAEEIAEIMSGTPVRLGIVGSSHPPVSVDVQAAK